MKVTCHDKMYIVCGHSMCKHLGNNGQNSIYETGIF